MNLSDGQGNLPAVARKAPREWRVLDGDDERLARSLSAVAVIGEFIGGTVEVTSPQTAEPIDVNPEGEQPEAARAWLFSWRDTADEPLRPRWTVPLEDDELMERSEIAVDLVTEFIGGAFQIGALREERDGEYVTVGRAFQWQSFLPTLRPVPTADELVPEPEPVAG